MPTTDAAVPATSGMTQATSQVQETAAAVDQITQKTGLLKSILNGIGGVFQKGFSLGTGALHKLGNAMTKVAATAGKAVKPTHYCNCRFNLIDVDEQTKPLYGSILSIEG